MAWWENYPWRMVQTNFREIDMADIDAKEYARNLADYGATVVTLNAGGIIASYDSKLPYHTVSKYLTGSSLKEMIEACHEKNIKVIARMDFSKIPYEVYEQHPQWAFRTAEGEIVEQNGFVQTCQNGEYQQEKTIEILEELLTTHSFDGVYCNMSGFVAVGYDGKIHGMCHCDSCRKGFWEAFHMELPTKMDMRDPVTMRYMGFQSAAGKKLRGKMTAAVKAINPEIAVDKVDYLRTESHTDIGEPIWIHSASSNSRQVAGPNRTMINDNASADYMGFRYRESGVSPEVQQLRQWQNLANAGNVSLYILGTLANHRDKASLESNRKVFQFHKKYQDIIMGLQSSAQVLLVMKAQQGRYDEAGYGWIRALTASHIPFDEVKTGDITEELLQREQVVILADTRDMKPEQATLLDNFVRNGGTLVAAGASGVHGDVTSLPCLGIQQIRQKQTGLMSTVLTVEAKDEAIFTRSAQSPVIAPGPEMMVADYEEGVEKYLQTESEPMYGPPEVCYAQDKTNNPGVTRYAYGQGKGIFIPWKCGSFYYNEGYTNTLNFIQDVLFKLCEIPQIAVNIHPSVELVLSHKEDKTVVSLINGSGYFGNSFYEAIPMGNMQLELSGKYDSAKALNGGNVTLKVQGEKTGMTLDRLEHFEMIVLQEA